MPGKYLSDKTITWQRRRQLGPSHTKRCTRIRRVCWSKFGRNPIVSFCSICVTICLSLVPRQGYFLDFACLSYTFLKRALNFLFVSPYMKMLRHALNGVRGTGPASTRSPPHTPPFLVQRTLALGTCSQEAEGQARTASSADFNCEKTSYISNQPLPTLFLSFGSQCVGSDCQGGIICTL